MTWLAGVWPPDGPDVLLLLGALVGTGLGLVFLRRALSDPLVADDPAAVRARGRSDVAVTAWSVSLVAGLVLDTLLDVGGTWLDVVRTLLGAVTVLAVVATLVLAVRWRPEQHAGAPAPRPPAPL